MLLNKKKFDLRLYVAVFGLEPMYAYIYREGMVRLCTQDYKRPTRENMRNLLIHLSNYSIQKLSENYDKDSDQGTKRKFSLFLN